MKSLFVLLLLAACSHPSPMPKKLPYDTAVLCKPYFAKLAPTSIPGSDGTIKQMDAYMNSGVSVKLHEGAHDCWGEFLDKDSPDTEAIACLYATLGGKRTLEVKVGTLEDYNAPQDVLNCIKKKSAQILKDKPFTGSEVDLFQPLSLGVIRH